MGLRYAVYANLDSSLNDIAILAENDHNRGAFRAFFRFCTPVGPENRGKMTGLPAFK
jgi:hypothetical protein